MDQTHFESKASKERARKKVLAAAKQHGIEVSEGDEICKRAVEALAALTHESGPA